ncbi:hypothetical protein [Streptomyces sp. NBC_01304]|uniref:hypothetical protein n=1 Tax=Streptomyces sp. NBC_01304 TaxID=2903818 RepID=UPI002E101EC1|nr:hypothetical protein OG430_42000 [Streptomyces sp. NBC_01304]
MADQTPHPPEPRGQAAVSAETTALAKARASGRRVEVLKERTETSQVFANPSGTFTHEQYSLPVRVRKAGRWVPIDTDLAKRADGTVGPKAVPGAMAFSGGGSAPVLQLGSGDEKLTLRWPAPLPEPQLEGDTATYRDVLPDVDLKIRAGVSGASQVLVVHTPQAAQDPALDRLRFAMDTGILDVTKDAQGNLGITDAQGNQVFAAPAPRMWDSSGPDSPRAQNGGAPTTSPNDVESAKAFSPDDSATHATMGTRLTEDALEITPDQGMLHSPKTDFPVFIDPWWSGGRQHWARVDKRFPTTTYWDKNESDSMGLKNIMRIGHENETGGTSRGFWQMDAKGLHGKTVIKSTYRIDLKYSWSCSARPVELWWTNAIASTTTWNKQPTWRQKLGSINTAKGWSSKDCPAGGIEYNITDFVRDHVVKEKWNTVTFGMRSTSETDVYGWKKFDNNPAFSTEYTTPPNVPTDMATDPAMPCTTKAPYAVLGKATGVTLKAKVSDPDGGKVTGRFQMHRNSDNVLIVNQPIEVTSGSIASHHVPAATIPDGSYRWAVRAEDGHAVSAFTVSCYFTVDTTAPKKPQLTQDKKLHQMAFTPDGDKDVVAYRYGFDQDQPTMRTNAEPDGTLKVAIPADLEDTFRHTLKVYAIDGAGNQSPVSELSFVFDNNKIAPGLSYTARHIEAESLLPAKNASATVRKQVNSCCGVSWSGGAQVLFDNHTTGGKYTLDFDVPATGRYGIAVRDTVAPAYGIVSYAVDGKKVGSNLDEYGTKVAPRALTQLGALDLAPGNHSLTMTVVGKNASSASYQAGIDYIQLTPQLDPEAEHLTLAPDHTAPVHRQQDHPGMHWSAGAQSRFDATKNGDHFTLKFDVPEDGWYSLGTQQTVAADYGTVSYKLDGSEVGERFDGYSAVTTTKPVALDVHELTKGTHSLTFTISGKNAASSGHKAGVDIVKVLPELGTYESELTAVKSPVDAPMQYNCCGVAWSGDHQSVVRHIQIGNEVDYAFTVPMDATYSFNAVTTRAPEFGGVTYAIDGKTVGARFDAYGPKVTTAPVNLGAHELTAGMHTLTVKMTDTHHPAAWHGFGVDALHIYTPDDFKTVRH